jgi:cell division protein FtsZ
MEVDEAANHIREMVDPEANIIWGTAFNPDLQGKIRVSVVATGIDTSGAQLQPASRPINLSSVRGPQAPVAAAAPERRFGALVPDTAPESVEDDALDLDALDEMAAEPAADEAEFDDVAPAPSMPEPADQRAFAHLGEGGFGAAPVEEAAAERGFDEADVAQAPARQDELLLDADRLIDADEEVQPMTRRRRMLGAEVADAEGAEAPVVPVKKSSQTGSTLFERMANLSRGSSADDAEDAEEDGAAMRIPRFLGRQNNQ